MKRFLLILVLCFVPLSNVDAAEQFRIVPLDEYVKSAGSFVIDTGAKVIDGIETTAFGLGEIVTAPFRADFYKPRKKTYYFKKPRLEFRYNSGRFYRE
tara:strand:- start:787 stop:1080 length:294 start_codon:yes stop_codon:yes gene_type:complete